LCYAVPGGYSDADGEECTTIGNPNESGDNSVTVYGGSTTLSYPRINLYLDGAPLGQYNSFGVDYYTAQGMATAESFLRQYSRLGAAVNTGPEPCSLGEVVFEGCGGGDTSSEAGILALSNRIFGAAGRAFVGMLAAARLVGIIGETVVEGKLGLPKNTTGIINTLSGVTRIPDFMGDTFIAEVKASSYISYTSQIQDELVWAIQNSKQFQLWVPRGAQLSATITDLWNKGLISLQWF
jgi:hypothetical protein